MRIRFAAIVIFPHQSGHGVDLFVPSDVSVDQLLATRPGSVIGNTPQLLTEEMQWFNPSPGRLFFYQRIDDSLTIVLSDTEGKVIQQASKPVGRDCLCDCSCDNLDIWLFFGLQWYQ